MITPSNYVPKTEPCTQQLRYQFSEKELLERGKKLAETNSKLAEIKNDKARVVKDFAAKESAVTAEAVSLAAMVNTGHEVREIPCTATMDTPSIGKKRITRDDTGEEVEIQPMTPSQNNDAQDARAKAEYDLKNPVLDLEAPKSDEEHTAESNEKHNPENNLPEKEEEPGDEPKEGEGEALSDEEQAELTGTKPDKKKKGKKSASPGDDF
jgi:hypothetical protein